MIERAQDARAQSEGQPPAAAQQPSLTRYLVSSRTRSAADIAPLPHRHATRRTLVDSADRRYHRRVRWIELVATIDEADA
jgi:hypothetical protein